jgi:hypothetical protein
VNPRFIDGRIEKFQKFATALAEAGYMSKPPLWTLPRQRLASALRAQARTIFLTRRALAAPSKIDSPARLVAAERSFFDLFHSGRQKAIVGANEETLGREKT